MAKYKLSQRLIIECAEEASLKELAFFYHLKRIYANSCIYNYSIASLSRKSGYSRTKIKKYISYFLKKGWAYFHGKNLIFAKNKPSFIIKIECEKKELIYHIQRIVLKRKQSQCLMAYKIRSDQHISRNIKTVKQYKHYKNLLRKFNNFSGERDRNFSISSHGLAEVFKCSASTANRLLLKLESNAMVEVRRIRKYLFSCTYRQYLIASRTINNLLWHKGWAWIPLPNILVLK